MNKWTTTTTARERRRRVSSVYVGCVYDGPIAATILLYPTAHQPNGMVASKKRARHQSETDGSGVHGKWKMLWGGPPPYGMDDSNGESITENGATETIHRRCVFGASKHDIRYTRCTVCSQQSVYECAGTYTQIHMHGNGYIFVFCGGSHTQSERDGACATEEPRVFLVDGANRMRRGQSRRRRSTGGKIERILC